jgi:hypothetical protein
LKFNLNWIASQFDLYIPKKGRRFKFTRISIDMLVVGLGCCQIENPLDVPEEENKHK